MITLQINALSTFFVGLGIAFWKGWQLTLVLFGFVPVLGIAALFLMVCTGGFLFRWKNCFIIYSYGFIVRGGLVYCIHWQYSVFFYHHSRGYP